MLLCATTLGLMCIAGPRLPVSTTPPPSLSVDQSAETSRFKLLFSQVDMIFTFQADDLRKACKAKACIRYDVAPRGCGLFMHVFEDHGDIVFSSNAAYTLTAPSYAALNSALSAIYIQAGKQDESSRLALSELPELRAVTPACGS